MEIARARASLPGVQNAVVIAVRDGRAENDRSIGVAGIQRRAVLVASAESETELELLFQFPPAA